LWSGSLLVTTAREMIPPLDPITGLLPPGIYSTTWDELTTRFGYNPHRRALLAGLRRALDALRAANCRRVYVDGSFITCWEIEDVDFSYLAAQTPILLHPTRLRAEQQAAFGGELFPARVTADPWGTPFLDFFQRDTRTGQSKGIVALDLLNDS
jgi:hypothetical protein